MRRYSFNARRTLLALAATLVASLGVATTAAQAIVVTVTGTNDAATITGTATRATISPIAIGHSLRSRSSLIMLVRTLIAAGR